MSKIETLHTHTTSSDGKLSHRELFLLAESLDIAVLAFTDHDALPTPEIMNELEGFRGNTTKWVTGIEITAGMPKEISGDTGSAHIIGLFVDPTNANLLTHCLKAQEDRIKRMQKMVSSLQNLGFEITENDCLEASGGDSVGRPHVVEALRKYPGNTVVMEKMRLEMAKESEQNPELQERYNYMMGKGERSYPYSLFLTHGAFREAYAEHEYLPDLDEAVSLIRNAGGVAIIAHYFTIRRKMPLDMLEKILSEKRIDGVEVVYGIGEYKTDREKIIHVERQTLRELAQKYNALALGGSDAHSKEDLEYYAENEWFSRETAGFTEKILATGKVNKKFSSL